MSDTTSGATTPNPSLTKIALSLAVGTAVLWIALGLAAVEGPVWLLVAALGLGAAVTGWMAGHGSRQNVQALVALVVGVVGVLSVIGWVLLNEL